MLAAPVKTIRKINKDLDIIFKMIYMTFKEKNENVLQKDIKVYLNKWRNIQYTFVKIMNIAMISNLNRLV